MIVTRRSLTDRLHDRVWREVGSWISRHPNPSGKMIRNPDGSSVSGTMPWVDACAAFASGSITSDNFRRSRAVRDVVETVGAVDGRFYAGRIHQWAPDWLDHPTFQSLDNWGNPVRWPGLLLGTRRAFSPTSLRYLASALWLKNEGLASPGTDVIEIGVGYGGLAAMNMLVSGAATNLIDLPPVVAAANRMLAESGFERQAVATSQTSRLLISNYAFSELSAELQDHYLQEHVAHCEHGVIVSNARIFADRIGGRSDEELIKCLRKAGVPAKIDTGNDLLGPGDALCGVNLIRW